MTDRANGLQTIAGQFPFPSEPVLDWFHILMRGRYLERIVNGLRDTSETETAQKSNASNLDDLPHRCASDTKVCRESRTARLPGVQPSQRHFDGSCQATSSGRPLAFLNLN
jgi:hypothetical protein